jgi:hypothetical protein
LPILLPTSGNFLGPKTRAATPAITASSGTPRPNKALQVRPFLALSTLDLVLVGPNTRVLLLGLVLLKKEMVALLVKKVELEEQKGREGGGTLGMEVETEERHVDEISIFFFFFFTFFFSGCGVLGLFWLGKMDNEGG